MAGLAGPPKRHGSDSGYPHVPETGLRLHLRPIHVNYVVGQIQFVERCVRFEREAEVFDVGVVYAGDFEIWLLRTIRSST